MQMIQGIRIQKVLAEQGVGSRRAVEELVKKGKISVNGHLAVLGQRVLPDDEISVSGKIIIRKEVASRLYLFHKPKGVECTFAKVPGHKTLFNFFPQSERYIPIGRLDKDSEGLLLMTNNGDFANRIMHPKYEHEKEYKVWVDMDLTSATLFRLSKGQIVLDKKPVLACSVEKLTKKTFRIILKEGRNRQIRRMCADCGLVVSKLVRERVEEFELGDLPAGKKKEVPYPKDK